MPRVLVLCTGNSCRSQMAEAIWRERGWQAFSAGSAPAGYIHPLAIRAMREIGLDIGGQTSKHVDSFKDEEFDLVLTVCDNARESCPVFPRARKTVHWSIADPAKAQGNEQQRLEAFRACRTELCARIEKAAAGWVVPPKRPN